MNPEQQIAELQAQIAAAQAQIAQIKSSVAEAKAKAVPEGMHKMPDGSIMSDADMESANLQERNTADALAAYEADKAIEIQKVILYRHQMKVLKYQLKYQQKI